MKSVMQYVSQMNKTLWEGQSLISGVGCQPETAFDEFLSTKLLYHKDGGVMFYHMVQSFPKGADIDPRAAHEAARRLAGYFEGCEVLVCTHTDREHTPAIPASLSASFTGTSAQWTVPCSRTRSSRSCSHRSARSFNSRHNSKKQKEGADSSAPSHGG